MKYPARFQRFLSDVIIHTPIIKMFVLMIVLWVIFSFLMYWVERDVPDSAIDSIPRALYWGVAAFSTAGIADTPSSSLALLIGGIWIVLGSAVFFGTIVATITTYFMRPLKRPAHQIVDAIEYNLEQLDDLSVEELELLKRTTDSLIISMEQVKKAQLKVGD